MTVEAFSGKAELRGVVAQNADKGARAAEVWGAKDMASLDTILAKHTAMDAARAAVGATQFQVADVKDAQVQSGGGKGSTVGRV